MNLGHAMASRRTRNDSVVNSPADVRVQTTQHAGESLSIARALGPVREFSRCVAADRAAAVWLVALYVYTVVACGPPVPLTLVFWVYEAIRHQIRLRAETSL